MGKHSNAPLDKSDASKKEGATGWYKVTKQQLLKKG